MSETVYGYVFETKAQAIQFKHFVHMMRDKIIAAEENE